MNLLGMISRLDPGNILYRLALHTLYASKISSRSWFLQVRDLLAKYFITDPLTLLLNPATMSLFNSAAKSKPLRDRLKMLNPEDKVSYSLEGSPQLFRYMDVGWSLLCLQFNTRL